MPVVTPPTIRTETRTKEHDLTDREVAILAATKHTSQSTVALAEAIGCGHNLSLVVPLLDRLERLHLLDGYFAAGCASMSSGAVHRRYYRLTERGRSLV